MVIIRQLRLVLCRVGFGVRESVGEEGGGNHRRERQR